jgi:hypothetical protein
VRSPSADWLNSSFPTSEALPKREYARGLASFPSKSKLRKRRRKAGMKKGCPIRSGPLRAFKGCLCSGRSGWALPAPDRPSLLREPSTRSAADSLWKAAAPHRRPRSSILQLTGRVSLKLGANDNALIDVEEKILLVEALVSHMDVAQPLSPRQPEPAGKPSRRDGRVVAMLGK